MTRIPRNPLNNSSPENPENQKFESLPAAYRKIAPYLNIGLVLAGSVLFFTWLGFTLDKYWSTRPWLTVVGAFLGIFTGFYHFIKIILSEEKKDQK